MNLLDRINAKRPNWSVGSRLKLRRADGSIYLDRVRIIQTPWLRVFAHRMDAPDPGLDLHDHPWTFVGMILKGGYTEIVSDIRTPAGCNQWIRSRPRWSIAKVGLHECHTITSLNEDQSWSLVVAWGKKREWGFYVYEEGYIPHYDYERAGIRRELSDSDTVPCDDAPRSRAQERALDLERDEYGHLTDWTLRTWR